MQLADAVYSAENERLVEDLQDKLEEARSELSQRRKEEKEMKGKERAQAIQISGVSGNVRFQQAGLTTCSSKQTSKACNEAWKTRRRIT